MKRIIALDGGTTNTRLTLMEDGTVCGRVKLSVGIRDGKEPLIEALRGGIRRLLDDFSLCEAHISHIAASGMVTSELGLYNLPHIPAPAGKAELSKAAARVSLDGITQIPFVFIPGVKTFASSGTPLDKMDIMRGEETEAVSILDRLGIENATLILPGSHMKIVNCESGRIVDFSTSVSGELTRAAAENTILKNSIGDAFFRDPDADAINEGFRLADTLGAGSALFKLRVAGNFRGADKRTLYSMLLGIILHDDAAAIQRSARGTVAVGGSNPFRCAYLTLLSGKAENVIEIPDELSENAAAYGAWAITK